MDLMMYLVVAGLLGWMATVILRDHPNLLINIFLAVTGAFLAGFFISPILHMGTINAAFNLPTALITLAGSMLLLAIFRILRGRRMQIG